ncbi:hypothetical protein SO802_011891 [Lithocarpus litseifolius]|uniref:Uncharacterized protein n=1 Tax=Lithocarpus litseifolius TaxID=425828 RepID=A0AAW2D5D1_9ROSI
MMNQNIQSKVEKAPKTWIMMVMMCPWHVKKMKKARTKEKLLLAGRMRRKKAEKSIPEDAMDDDYDFKVDYVRKRSAMDVGDEDDGNQIIGKVPMSGIEFTDE